MFDINNSFTYTYSSGVEADNEQAIGNDVVSTNAINLQKNAGKDGINIAAGKRPIYLIVKTGAAAWTGGSGSLEIQLCTSTAADKTTGKKVIQKWRIPYAKLGANTILVNQALPVALYQNYLFMFFNIFTTVGGIKAYLSDSPESAEQDVAQQATGS